MKLLKIVLMILLAVKHVSELNMLVIESASNLTDDQKTKLKQLAIKNFFFFFAFRSTK